jgi:Tol biopolymer transport system component
MLFSIIFFLFSCEGSIINSIEGLTEGRILFIKEEDNISEICSIKPDGTDLQIIASHNIAGEFPPSGYLEAQWSHDKSRIVITGGPSESLEYHPLWLMDDQGNLLYRITWNGASPNWSSDDNEILFARARYYFSFLVDYFIVNINTLDERLVLKADSLCWANADWSADGNYILTNEEYYWYNDDGKQEVSDKEVVLLQLSNGERLQITDTDVMDSGARWSPDESKIVYISGRYTLGYQIKIMNSDGSGKTVLVETLAGYNTILWSPSGDKIAFNKHDKLEGYCNYTEGSDLFILDLNSGVIQQLTNFEADSINVYVQDWK